jgi:uncharacterized membrane protein YphA (DoxX/SURF4 family)
MKVALWILQVLLAAVFLLAGGMKLTLPISDLAQQMQFVETVPAWLVRFIGIAEIIGAVGLIAPALLRIKPWLTPLAATGLGTVMAMAAGLHLARQEYMDIGVTGLFFGLLAFVAWGRWKLQPIAERGRIIARPPEERYHTEAAHAH